MRLDKRVAGLGFTRAQAKKKIASGEAKVNGRVERDPGFPVLPEDDVRLSGASAPPPAHAHIMLNKPAGVLTATEDARGQKTVLDLIPAPPRGLGPVGRLDKDVTGLVLLTTDGQLAHRLISPRWENSKVYTARVSGALSAEHVRAFESGVPLRDFTAKPARLEILAGDLARVTVTEGKYHQVKRMFQAIGCPVTALKRESIAGLPLDESLAEGEWRPLTEAEIALLYRAAGMNDIEG